MDAKEREELMLRAEFERNISSCRRDEVYGEDGEFPPGMLATLAGHLQARYGNQGPSDTVAVFQGEKNGVSVQVLQPWRYDNRQEAEASGFARGFIEAHRAEIDAWRQRQEAHQAQIQRSRW